MSKSIGKNIKTIRNSIGMTQTEVAEKLYTTPQNISRVESGEGEPTVEMLICMADVFNVSLDTLVGRTETPEKDLMNKIQIYFKSCEKDEVSNRLFNVCENILSGRYQRYFENFELDGRETFSTLLERNLTGIFSNRADRPRMFAVTEISDVKLSEDSKETLVEVFDALSKPSVMHFINNMSCHSNLTYDRYSFCSSFDIKDENFEHVISLLQLLGLITVKQILLNDCSVTVYQPHLNEKAVLLLSLADLLYNSKPDGNAH